MNTLRHRPTHSKKKVSHQVDLIAIRVGNASEDCHLSDVSLGSQCCSQESIRNARVDSGGEFASRKKYEAGGDYEEVKMATWERITYSHVPELPFRSPPKLRAL